MEGRKENLCYPTLFSRASVYFCVPTAGAILLLLLLLIHKLLLVKNVYPMEHRNSIVQATWNYVSRRGKRLRKKLFEHLLILFLLGAATDGKGLMLKKNRRSEEGGVAAFCDDDEGMTLHTFSLLPPHRKSDNAAFATVVCLLSIVAATTCVIFPPLHLSMKVSVDLGYRLRNFY